jgi:penicillin amidase
MMKKWVSMIGVILLGLIFVVAGGGYLWVQHAIKKSLPQTSGEVTLGGLKEDVEIIRDTYGVPHIYAQNEPDLYFALGYAMAQDRLWQMEFYRRLGLGRLSEDCRGFHKVDRYFRTITQAIKNIPDDSGFCSNLLMASRSWRPLDRLL